MALTDRQRAILDLERSWWRAHSSKGVVIRDRLGLSPARYYTLLADLAGSPDAEAYDPLVVRRVRKRRSERRRARFEGRPAGERPLS
ncbi:MAG: DUF3263 domain-containing protein [Acidimicrobiales bacterium]